MAWTDQLIHFIDFEGSTVSGILEYGIVSMQAGEIRATSTRKCCSTGRVRPEDVAVHGLDESQVAHEAPFAGEFERFAGLRETGPLAAHFAQAENTLLKSVWPYARKAADYARSGHSTNEWGPWVDTGRLYPQLYASIASAKLSELIEVFQLQADLDRVAREHCPADRCHYHAALYDALAGALLLRRLGTESGIAGQSMGWLLTMSTLDPGKREAMTQGDLF